MYSFSNLKPVCCSMSGSNCCLLTCIQISQEAGKVIWYSHLLNFPLFVVIHISKSFGIVSKAEVDVFLEFGVSYFEQVFPNMLPTCFVFLSLSIDEQEMATRQPLSGCRGMGSPCSNLVSRSQKLLLLCACISDSLGSCGL